MKYNKSMGYALSRVITQARSIRHKLTLQMFPEHMVTHTFLDTSLQVVIADPTAKLWYEQALPQASELHFLRDYSLKPGKRVFDIGAHQAVIASMLAHIVGPQGSVVALEPDPFSYQMALKNKFVNNLNQLHLVHAAGADSSRMIEFSLGLSTSGNVASQEDAFPKIPVQALSVDDLTELHGPPDILYIDVEGFEQHVLQGASKTLSSYQPDCVVEVHIGVGLEKLGGSLEGVLAYFPRDSYHILIKHPDPSRRNELVPLDDVGIENWNYHCNMVAVKKNY